MSKTVVYFVLAAAMACCTLAASAQNPPENQPPAAQTPQTQSSPPAVPKPPSVPKPPTESKPPASPAVVHRPEKPAPEPGSLEATDLLLRHEHYEEAEAAYRALLAKNPKLIAAQVGLVRSLLRQDNIDEALTTAKDDLAAEPNSAALLDLMGDVHFRRAEMPEAERSYRAAVAADPNLVRAYLGLARLYRAYSLYRHAYDVLQIAHHHVPNDPALERMLIRYLPRKEKIAALESYLSQQTSDDPEEDVESLQDMLDYLKENSDKPVHACRLVSKVERTETKLEALYGSAQHITGYGMSVKLNDHNLHMMLDTGSSGILVGRKTAEKAGLTRLSALRMMGIGDKGTIGGYTAVAAHIRIGELEFEDCVVEVTDKANVTDEQGLIGADVFSAYLIDINLPDRKLRLSPLPNRPDEAIAPTSLNTSEDASSTPEEKSAEEKSGEPAKTVARDDSHLPKDRYVAPEMQNWTKVFRFGHELLMPTWVNNSPPLLFLIDTGSNGNLLSLRAARKVTSVGDEPEVEVHGLSGSVKKVYTGHRATLTFSRFQQKNQEIITIDLNSLCQSSGTEVSGVLGFDVLHQLETKIDYRDGLVDFVYSKAPGK